MLITSSAKEYQLDINQLIHRLVTNHPIIEKRCLKGRGEDWPRIAHIPDIHIGGNWDLHSIFSLQNKWEQTLFNQVLPILNTQQKILLFQFLITNVTAYNFLAIFFYSFTLFYLFIYLNFDWEKLLTEFTGIMDHNYSFNLNFNFLHNWNTTNKY